MLVYELWINSKLSRAKFGWEFFWTRTWDPIFDNFGAAPFIYGTLVTAAVSLAIAVPLGLAAAVFLAELAPRKMSDSIAFLIDLLAAVPSVIYGLLGIFVIVPLMRTTIGPIPQIDAGISARSFRGPNYGVGFPDRWNRAGNHDSALYYFGLARGVVDRAARTARSGLGLGATRWESTWQVVVPWARTGVMGSIFLALARALGETMAVTMVIGNDPKIAASLFAPGYTIAAVIANEFTEATGNLYLSALIELGLVLFLMTFILNGLARILIVATERGGGHPA
jgi:phosphate transport system permease protein